MSSEGPDFEPCDCDHERIFELAVGDLSPEAARDIRRHLQRCPGCRELYEHETELNCYLDSMNFPEPRPCSVHRGVAMALPTRSRAARLSWAALAGALLVVALVYLELNGTEPVMVAMSVLTACWGFVSGSAGIVSAVLTAAGSTILLVLAVGALADLLIALAFVFVRLSRGRRTREA